MQARVSGKIRITVNLAAVRKRRSERQSRDRLIRTGSSWTATWDSSGRHRQFIINRAMKRNYTNYQSTLILHTHIQIQVLPSTASMRRSGGGGAAVVCGPHGRQGIRAIGRKAETNVGRRTSSCVVQLRSGNRRDKKNNGKPIR